MMKRLSLLVLVAMAAHAISQPTEFKAMTWNIWRGGKEDGEQAGPAKVADVIRQSGADIVALQETYGSGEQIARSVGMQFHPRGTNVSILTRFPVIEDISVFEEFKCVGALVELPNGERMAFYSIWLPYDVEIWEKGTRNSSDLQSLLDACRSSATDLAEIRRLIAERLSDKKYRDVSLVLAGDFNSMSHLDYTEVAVDEYKAVVQWPTSQEMSRHGFRDSYREINPQVHRMLDSTWTPRFPEQEQDRMDFIYYRGDGLEATASKTLYRHQNGFPSDHAAVVTTFRNDPRAVVPKTVQTRIVSYNIKHGRGMDDAVDLDRTAAALRELKPDIVGLQEVDLCVTRSGDVNQAADLGRKLGMHAAFGTFMDLQGGRYGMALLSRYPFRKVESIALPGGNEPRVALAAEVRLPSGESMMVVNVHFDWVDDDGFRFAQASALADYLRGLTMPYVLLGDFNDVPESRTLSLFRRSALEAVKPRHDRFTFSSVKPESEIDFIFAAPKARWTFSNTNVVSDPLTSDHRPVVTFGTLKP